MSDLSMSARSLAALESPADVAVVLHVERQSVSAKCEGVGLHVAIEELDLEQPVDDGLGLPDQLI